MKKTNKRKKRLTKAERAIAEAKRLAGLLADAPPASGGALAPPAFIAESPLGASMSILG